jgi:hypothetical protein
VQLGAGEKQDSAGGREHHEIVDGLVAQRARPGLLLAGHLLRGGEPLGVVLVIVEGV